MALTDEDLKVALRSYIQTAYTQMGDIATLTTADIKAAAQALDTWLDDNAATINSILPQPFRGTATPGQKALILAFTALRRYEVI